MTKMFWVKEARKVEEEVEPPITKMEENKEVVNHIQQMPLFENFMHHLRTTNINEEKNWFGSTLFSSSMEVWISEDHLWQRLEYLEKVFGDCNLEKVMIVAYAREIPGEFWNGWRLFKFTTDPQKNKFDFFHYFVNQKYDFIFQIALSPEDKDGVGHGHIGQTITLASVLTRATVIASEGNILITDWGLPCDYGRFLSFTKWSDAALAEIFEGRELLDHDKKEEIRMHKKPVMENEETPHPVEFPNSHDNQLGYLWRMPFHEEAFAKIIRSGHYIRAIKALEHHLSEETLDKIHKAARGELFDEGNRWALWCYFYNSLNFAAQEKRYKKLFQWPVFQSVREAMVDSYYDWID